MRKIFILILAVCALVFSVSAHPGRTDAQGGHHDSSTGEYHWHHGESAHQHYDIDGDGDLDCPLAASSTTAPPSVPTRGLPPSTTEATVQMLRINDVPSSGYSATRSTPSFWSSAGSTVVCLYIIASGVYILNRIIRSIFGGKHE